MSCSPKNSLGCVGIVSESWGLLRAVVGELADCAKA